MNAGQSRQRTSVATMVAFAAVYFLWGSTYLAIKVVVSSMPALTAAGIRFLIAGVAVYVWARFRGAPRPERTYWPQIAVLGALMFVPSYGALFLAERLIPSGTAAVLVATLPLWTLLVETVVLRQRVATAPLAAALAAGFAGVVLLTGVAGGDQLSPPVPLVPCLAIMGGTISWAVGSVLTKRLRLPSSSAVTAGAEMIWGGFLLLVIGGARGEWRTLDRPSGISVAALAYLIVAGSIIAYSAYTWLLGRTSPTRLASYSYVNPVVALGVGYQFGGERLSLHAVYGALLVIASVALVLLMGRGGAANSGEFKTDGFDRRTGRS